MESEVPKLPAVRSIAWLDVTGGNESGVMLEELGGGFATN
jgi:hypothetical protein